MTAPEAYDKHIKEAVRKANRFIQVSPPEYPEYIAREAENAE